MVRAAALAFGLALIAAASAPAEIVAHGVRDGMLSLGPGGAPYVAYIKGQSLLIAQRSARGRWTVAKADEVSKGTQLMAFGRRPRGSKLAPSRLFPVVRFGFSSATFCTAIRQILLKPRRFFFALFRHSVFARKSPPRPGFFLRDLCGKGFEVEFDFLRVFVSPW